jgi:hypothetical protein
MKQTEWQTWGSWNLSARFLTDARKTVKRFFSAQLSMTKSLTLYVIIKPIR